MQIEFNIGDVFLWKDFPLPKGEPRIKDRWFIYLSDYQSKEDRLDFLLDSKRKETQKSEEKVFILAMTTTTRFHHIAEEGQEEGVTYLEFFESDNCGFTTDCLLLQDKSFREDIKKTLFEEHLTQGNITKQGSLPNQKLVDVWKIISGAKTITSQHKNRILQELKSKNVNGLTELKPLKKGRH